MRTLPDSLRREPPKLTPSTEETHTWNVEAITPVLGGGIDSFEPDTHDVVRVPSVRGSLRWWWRALHCDLDVERLREEERKIWGGVGATPEDTHPSAVRVRVEVQTPGRVTPAGEHEMRGGRPVALLRWLGGRELGYGLFPLQRSAAERNAWSLTSAMPTRSLRTGLTFSLSVSFQHAGSELPPDFRRGVLDAVAAWLLFGGYGARTRRGFGALASTVTLSEGRSILVRRRVGASVEERPTVRQCALYQSATVFRSAEDAHRALLGAMMEFRQKPGFARNPGAERPGRSRWPEPDTLRWIVRKYAPQHRPSESAWAAPRAAFGLPIVVTFKDREDSPADAMLVPTQGGRWASPVILRPVKVEGGYRAVVLRLAGHVPSEVIAHGTRVPVIASEGASGEIVTRLQRAQNDATVAFTQWLCDRHSFMEVT